MICFKDRTFCSSKNHKPECDRRWTPELQAEADRWWGKPGAPVSFTNFCGGEEIEPDADPLH
jgi:hypothetical protein